MTTSPKPSISLSTPSTPITQRRTVTYDSTRIPKPPSNTRLQRSSSMHMRTIGSSSPVTKCAAELNDGKTINSSNVYSLTGTTEFNCKNSKRSPNGTSHTPDIEKGFASRTIGNHCASSTRHGMHLNLKNHGSGHSHQQLPRSPQSPFTTCMPRKTPRTPPVTPDSPLNGLERDDDLDSMYSYSSITSCRSSMSTCEHPYVARNGTTFSGRKMKYVVHCSSHAGQTGEEYLTPTQRAQRHIHRLKMLLSQARMDLEQRDSEILRLTKEVVELRLFKASLSSPEDRSNSSDAVTVRENNDLKTSQDVSPIVDMINDTDLKSGTRHLLHSTIAQVQYMDKMSNSSEMQSSYADSGHFEDITTSLTHSKESIAQVGCEAESVCSNYEQQRQNLVRMYEQRIEELIRKNDEELLEMKTSHSERVEGLLQKLAECNSRYADLAPSYEQAKEKIIELEKQLEGLQLKLSEKEDKENKMYLHMYTKDQQDRVSDKVHDPVEQGPSRLSVPELIQQLQVTQNELDNLRDIDNESSGAGSSQVLLSAKEAISLWLLGARKTMYRRLLDAQNSRNKVDPEVTLQFLKSAVYYFFTDKENSQGHLNAIESILGFSDVERMNIHRAISN